jgi:uracil phosphoribosyltransferase
MSETAYNTPIRPGAETPHAYGKNVHVLADPWALSLLSRLGQQQTDTATFHRLLRTGYRRLLHAVTAELRTQTVTTPTRMAALEPTAAFHGTTIDASQPIVIVDIARAGIIPSDVFQQELLDVIVDRFVRVDHLYMQRRTDDAGRVVGVDLSGSKVGGPVEDATLLIPDPMGATGGSIRHAIEHYNANVEGTPRRIIACHLMVTPEYIRALTTAFPDVLIYTLRVDRGMSPAEVLQKGLGEDPRESGLTDTQYIVPGAGGLGELINNAFV